ncbi:MAG: hypothetical protein ACK5PP_07890 [Acidimicrobiales bacterium]
MTPAARSEGRGLVAVAGALLVRPRLWLEAAAAAWSLVPRRWWRRRPFLPIPDRRWLRFRTVTAYGGSGGALGAEDVITWLEWRRRFGDGRSA